MTGAHDTRVPQRGLPGRAVVWAAVVGLVVVAVTTGSARPARADFVRDAQWMLAALDVEEAWETTRGLGVLVGVVDDGVARNLPDLEGNIVDVNNELVAGAKGGNEAHGTAISSLIVGHGHGSGNSAGVVGIAPKAEALVVDIPLGKRGSTPASVSKAVEWLVDRDVQVINLSLGSDKRMPPSLVGDLAPVITKAVKSDVVVVAAAGNEGDKGNWPEFPGALPGVITVAAIDRNHAYASFSQHLPYVDVAAPGVDVAVLGDDGQYYLSEGTSQASAVVSGVVALVRSEYPDIPAAWIPAILRESTTNSPDGGYDQYVGWGTVNAANALKVAGRYAKRLKSERMGATAPAFDRVTFDVGGNAEGWTEGPVGEPLPDDKRLVAIPWLGGGMAGTLLAAVLASRLLRRRPQRAGPPAPAPFGGVNPDMSVGQQPGSPPQHLPRAGDEPELGEERHES